MSESRDDRVGLEPERYELREGRSYRFEFERRDFLRALTAMGGGLLVVATLPEAAAQESGQSRAGGSAPGDLASWIHIDGTGHVTVYTGKVEIGQNIRTSLAQTVGDELRVRLSSISLVMADTALTPFDQGTFGSRTTPTMAPQLAKVAATAREILIDLAAAAWNVDRTTLKSADGKVTAANGRSATYGELTAGKALAGAVAASPVEMPRDAWTLRGTPARKVDGRAFVTGQHAYSPDIVRPNMQVGKMVRPIAVGATPRSVDDSKARALDGVTVVRDGAFIGVVAPHERAARAAAAAVVVEWDRLAGQPTSATIYDHLKQTSASSGGRGGGGRVVGDVAAARSSAAHVLEASYHIPYIAHVPLEPRSAVAEWADGNVTVWCGTQRPFGVRTEVADAFHLAEDHVRVIVPDMGSAYGGKHTGEHAIEAARLAKAAGRPVKIVYTRAEEFMFGYLRPAGVIDVRAAVDASGRLTSWEFDNYNSGNAAIQTPYVVPNQRVAFHASDSPFRQGSYRGLAATANNYVREMHMDAVARAIGADAVEFRLKHIDDPRLRAVLTAAAEKSGWPKPSAPGRALGIACGVEKGGYIATTAELSKTADGFKIERLVVVFECGAIVNPDGLRNQTEGAVVQGLGGALFEAIEFADGQMLNGTMAQYRVPRFKDVPPIDVILLDRRDLPSAGAGETPIICVAPAIGAAARAFGTVETRLPVTLRT
ncbi:MAG TPA: molybdopterin cofactor-binding domain-containing protein [Vicinamibacterales bacterium]|nr:molybdopterin cofactor-binding domain-containing protein [Vicinamibacterales bacterium]